MRLTYFTALLGAGLLLGASAASASTMSVRYGNGPQTIFADGQFEVSGTTNSVSFNGNIDSYAQWIHGSFSAPSGDRMTRGTYLNAERDPFKTGRAPGADAGYTGSGCNEVWGDFTVRQIAHNDAGELTMLDATMNRACGPGGEPLTVVIKWKAPAYQFSMQQGDAPMKTYLGNTSDMALYGTRQYAQYGVSGQRDDWYISMQAPTGGSFKVRNYAVGNPDATHAGFGISGNGYYCGVPTGTLTVNGVRYDAAGNMTGLNAVFVGSCGGWPYKVVIRHYM